MDRIEYLLALAVLHSVAIAPPLAGFYANLLDLAVPRLRRVGMRNLAMALPEIPAEERRRILDGVFRNIARILTTLAIFPRIGKANVHDYIGYEGFEHFERALERGKGVLFATAHLGNWELSAFAHALMARPMHVVVRPLDNARIDGLVSQRRVGSGNRLIGKKDFARSILRALKDNQAVGILIDQNAGLDDGVFINFFGVPACAGAGFVKFAAHSGAAVIPGFALWSEQQRKYILRFYPPVPMSGDTARDTQALHAQLESVIREYPDQWLWLHRRWKTRPPGAPDLYV